MRHQEITEGKILKNLIDPKAPLKFTGKRKGRTQFRTTTILLFLNPSRLQQTKIGLAH